MRIDRLTVRDFRNLENVEIEGLEPSITVIAGENEEGKSTLLKALQAAFFDRHGLTGKAIDEILPFGTKGLRPSVDVEFEVDGTQYRLEKAFSQNPAALLAAGTGRWQGDHAEDRLRELLGFSQPGRGAAKEEHRGLAGLLWVEQGRAFQPLEMNRDSQAVLREAIEEEVGQVLGGERGRRLLDAVEKRWSEYYTPTGREKETLGGHRKRVTELEEKYEERTGALRDYDKKVEALETLRGRLARYRRDGSLAEAKEDRDRADSAVRQLEEVDTGVATAGARMEETQAVAATAQREKILRADLATQAAAHREETSKAEEALRTLEPEGVLAQRTLAEAEARFERASRLRGTAEAAWQFARRTRERAELTAQLQESERQLGQAESLIEEADRERQTLAGNPVDEDTLDKLRDLDTQRLRLGAALDASAASLAFAPEDGRTVSLDGRPVDTSGSVRVSETKTFHLLGFGAMEVTPGGTDILRLRTDLAEIDGRWQSELRRLGLADLAAAEAALRARQASAGRLEGLNGRLDGTVPEGVEELRQIVRKIRESLMPLGQDTDLPDVEPARRAEADAETRRDAAVLAAEGAMQERDTAKQRHDKAREEQIAAEANLGLKTEQLRGLEAALARAREELGDEELAERVREAEKELAERRAKYRTLQDQREALDPEAVKIEQERAREAYDRLEESIRDAEREERDLTVELRALGQSGLAEELERMEGELEIARRELDRIEADAKAWKLLLETLRKAESEAKETFLEPVRERLRPYLRMLFPETELRLKEDDLEIEAIVRNGVAEPFVSLSVGAREQIAVLTRLALADLLHQKGKPVALILDDPLVNSDGERFRRMQLALRKAAASIQIIVLTCHEERYESLGAKTIRLANRKNGG